jgi:glycosyltransferase involved in cell wall biosynthesis
VERHELLLDVFPLQVAISGIARFVRELADALTSRPDAPPARLVYPAYLRNRARPSYAAERLRPLPITGWAMLALLRASANWGLRPDRLYGRPAVVHSPMGYGPIFARTRLLLTIHDLMFLHHPEWHSRGTISLLGSTVPNAARHATLITCDSEFVRGQVAQLPGVEPSRVVTVHPAVPGLFRPQPVDEARRHVRERFGLDGDFVLHVGAVVPRKNHVRLVGAFERLRQAGFAGRLALVGQDDWQSEAIHARLASSPQSGSIVRVRDATDADLAALYNACTMFVFPSLDEGFGYPLAEAMACGAACITSNRSSLVEVAGNGAVQVTPEDAEELAEAMIALWRDPDRRSVLGAEGRTQAAQFSHERWIGRMFEIYRSLLSGAH